MQEPLLERLQQGPLLVDGAMGTLLYSRLPGAAARARCFDEVTLSRPELVRAIHQEYIRAGAQVIETNTFGANRAKLANYDLADKVREINMAAARLAREAREITGESVFLAGAVGPSGRPLQAPLTSERDEQHMAELRAIFREQVEALLEGGVDLIMLETFSDLAELRQALLAVKASCDLPVVAQMSFGEDGRTLAGQSPAKVALTLAELGANVVGANCSVGPSGALDVIEEMAVAVQRLPHVTLSAQPNAGLPSRIEQRFLYVSTPEYFADYARRFASTGVRLIGGCCGTTPRHTLAMRQTLGDKPRPQAAFSLASAAPTSTVRKPANGVLLEEEEVTPKARTPTRLQQKLEAGEFVVMVELDPPKGLNPAKILEGARLLKDVGVEFINIADSPMARVRMSCLAMARLIRDHLDMESIIHFTTRDRNLMGLQSDLLGAHALGIRNILALTGDPIHAGDYPNLTGIWNVDSVGLIRILKGMNEGHDAAGASLGGEASFYVGAGLNLNMNEEIIDLDRERTRRKLKDAGDGAVEANEEPQISEIDLELERYDRKLAAGADYIMTQPIYDIAVLERFLERKGKPSVPMILGMIPLHSFRHAERLHNEVAGITISDAVRAQMREAGERGREVGMELARQLLLEAKARGYIQGCYLMPSFGRYDVVSSVARSLLE
ncbi:MAG TPA: bifunctional homocysteine S-methyltransferase/methylenetetrahydrofolate reductase [Ktedonobacterales bacterium]|nr:bifunctional homocysteine S-methyltransferase/methylenetetrahydrofolate reductase [Ktedonobacterales bacterium]